MSRSSSWRTATLAHAELVGRAYDSVFKELCSSGQLRIEDDVVLTPFAFVSALAGVLRYFDFVQSMRQETFREYQNFNFNYSGKTRFISRIRYVGFRDRPELTALFARTRPLIGFLIVCGHKELSSPG